MQDINVIKDRVGELFVRAPEVHIDVHSTRPKVSVSSLPAKIVGVYRNFFRIEAVEDGMLKAYTVQYTDLFIGRVKIAELDLK